MSFFNCLRKIHLSDNHIQESYLILWEFHQRVIVTSSGISLINEFMTPDKSSKMLLNLPINTNALLETRLLFICILCRIYDEK
jgi:hypothetical protein